MKILIVVGTRPNITKIALLYKSMAKEFGCLLVHTGQHYDKNMSDDFFNELELPEPRYNIGIGSGSHAEQIGKMLIALEPVLVQEKPDLVLIPGDTNSSLAGALIANKLRIPIAHIEAGVRCRDMSQPEEWNRLIIDRISDLNFCPTRTAQDNLKGEAITSYFAGDIMLDNFLHYKPKNTQKDTHIFVTIHRQENVDAPDRLNEIIKALNIISLKHQIIFPIHPRTVKQLRGKSTVKPKFKTCEPLGYTDTLKAISGASLVITDSGGLQKEAYFAGVPCITVSKYTAWPETLVNGANCLAYKRTDIYCRARARRKHFEPDLSLFGSGKAVSRIIYQLKVWQDCR